MVVVVDVGGTRYLVVVDDGKHYLAAAVVGTVADNLGFRAQCFDGRLVGLAQLQDRLTYWYAAVVPCFGMFVAGDKTVLELVVGKQSSTALIRLDLKQTSKAVIRVSARLLGRACVHCVLGLYSRPSSVHVHLLCYIDHTKCLVDTVQ